MSAAQVITESSGRIVYARHTECDWIGFVLDGRTPAAHGLALAEAALHTAMHAEGAIQ